ncbi:MAG: hypothetical protein Q8O93_03245 [bacterium]|nr:hypothetical protein [bacterium]
MIFCTILLNDNRNRKVAYFNWNDKQWVLNFNWLDNNFNDNARFVRPRYYLLAPPVIGGVSFISCLCQPPSILPISIKGADSSANFLLSIALSSQAICIKNLSRSNFNEAFLIIMALFSLVAKLAVKISSASSINRLLIFSPRE